MKRYYSLLAGLALSAGPVLVYAQDYIDLEAERLAESAATTVNTVPTPEPSPAQAPSAAGNLGELFYQVQLLQQEVMQLRGQVEEQAFEIRQLKQQGLERYQDLDSRLRDGGEVASGGEETSTGATPTAPAQEPAGEGDAYRAAYSLVRSQKFDDAVNAFRQFLLDFPDGRYAPNAHYWLGELYLVISPPDLERSRQSFVLLLEQYPGNSKEADAMYKLGKVYFQKGNRDKAREYLDRVIAEHGSSNSSAVKLARDFIAENY